MKGRALLVVRITSVLLGMILISGCGGSGGSRGNFAAVEGVVLYNQNPIEGAMVVFVPEGNQPGAAGRTDGKGRFRLQTHDPGDGAAPGEYKVTVRKTDTQAMAGDLPDDHEAPETQIQERWLLPQRYGNPTTSGLTASVQSGQKNEFTFELTE